MRSRLGVLVAAVTLCEAIASSAVAQFLEHRDALVSPPDVRISAYPGNDAGYAGVPGDVNGDGYDDVLVSQVPSPILDPWGIGLYLGSANPPPQMSANGPPGSGPVVQLDRGQSTASPEWGNNHNHIGDVNGDGRDDILVGPRYPRNSRDYAIIFGQSEWPTSMIRAQFGEADVYFQFATTTDGSLHRDSILTSADFNGDGIEDLIFSHNVTVYGQEDPYYGRIGVFLGRTDWPDFFILGAPFEEYSYFGTPQQYAPILVSAADINRDGYDEMIGLSRISAPEQTQDFLSVVWGAPEMSMPVQFNGESSLGVYNEPLGGDGVIFDDFNGDGLIDMALQRTAELLLFFDVARWTPTSNNSSNPNVRIALQVEQPENTFSIHAGDANGDGITDLLFVDYYTRLGMSDSIDDKSIHIFYGRPNWPSLINLATQFADVTLIGIEQLRYGTGLHPNGIPFNLMGDLNGDGADDIFLNHGNALSIVLGNRDLPSIIRIQDGEADFTIGNVTVPEIGPVFLDFNGDGIKDFLFQSGLYDQPHDVHILFGQPAPANVYVNTTASAPGNGTKTKPYRSIRLGLKTVEPGGTVHVSGPAVIEKPQRLSKPVMIRRQ